MGRLNLYQINREGIRQYGRFYLMFIEIITGCIIICQPKMMHVRVKASRERWLWKLH